MKKMYIFSNEIKFVFFIKQHLKVSDFFAILS